MSEISIKENSRGGNKNKIQKCVERWREGEKKEREREKETGAEEWQDGDGGQGGGRSSHEKS